MQPRIKFLTLFIVILIQLVSAQQWNWIKQAGSFDNSTNTPCKSNDIASDNNGNIYVVGQFEDSAKFGDTTLHTPSHGYINNFLCKYTPAGQLKWIKGIRSGYAGNCPLISVTSDNSILIAGYYVEVLYIGDSTITSGGSGTQAAFFARFDTLGNFTFFRQVTGLKGYVQANACYQASNGEVYLTGEFSGTIQLGNNISLTARGESDMFLVKYSSTGRTLWADQAGRNGYHCKGLFLAQPRTDHILVAGIFNTLCIFGDYSIPDTISIRGRGDDIFLAKYDYTYGDFLQVKSFGGPNYEQLSGFSADSLYNLYFLGRFTDTITNGGVNFTALGLNSFVFKADSTLNTKWLNTVPASLNDIFLESNSTFTIAGNFNNTVSFFGALLNAGAGQTHALVASFDSSCSLRWVKQGGGTTTENGGSAALTFGGATYLSGFVRGQAAFDDSTIDTKGSINFFLAKITQTSSLQYYTNKSTVQYNRFDLNYTFIPFEKRLRCLPKFDLFTLSGKKVNSNMINSNGLYIIHNSNTRDNSNVSNSQSTR